jgi:transposase
MRLYREITDYQWSQVAPLLPESRPREDLRGRPLANTRQVLNGVLWVVCSGSSWASLPRTFPPYQTCHRRFKAWHEDGALEAIVKQLFGPGSEAAYLSILSRMRTSRGRLTTYVEVRPKKRGDHRRRFGSVELAEAIEFAVQTKNGEAVEEVSVP